MVKYSIHDTILSYFCYVLNNFIIRSLQNVHFEVSVFSATLQGPRKQIQKGPQGVSGWKPTCSLSPSSVI